MRGSGFCGRAGFRPALIWYWDQRKCLNYLTKSTRKSVANSSRSCGTVFALHHRCAHSDRRRRRRLARLPVLEAKKAAEAGAAFESRRSCRTQDKHQEAEAAFTSWSRLHRRAIACWRGCAKRRKSPAATTSRGQSVRRDRGRPGRRRGGAGSGRGSRRGAAGWIAPPMPILRNAS